VEPFVFPTWVNQFVKLAGAGAALAVAYGATVYVYGTLPSTLNTGYSPEQPVPFSHKVHAGDLKMDCRYCHNTIEVARHAAVPPTNTCANCHAPSETGKSTIHVDSRKLLPVRKSYNTGQPIQWERVHDLADYVYFDHASHVNRGVSCVECHGRVDKMERVWQDKPLSMAYCLDCHRDPEPRLRPRSEITNLEWKRPEDLEAHLAAIKAEYGDIKASTACSTCHR
jgi:menaquinone reductase, multiheme cytochrome c subunit